MGTTRKQKNQSLDQNRCLGIGSPLGPPQNKSNQKGSGSPSTISVFQPQDPIDFSCVPVLMNCLQVVTTACFFAECVAVSDETCCNDYMKVK